MVELPFRDRAQAGRLLGQALAVRGLPPDLIVLALPRGGVPVGFEIAKVLRAPLDVLVVRKLGVPWQPELAMGAVASGDVRILDEPLMREAGVSAQEVERISRQETLEVRRREQLYRPGRPPLAVEGRAVVLVDDGLATGSTMLAAIQCMRGLKASFIWVAAPVASRPAAGRVRKLADDCVFLATPEPFAAVGEWYEDFRQTTDREVQDLLEELRAGSKRT